MSNTSGNIDTAVNTVSNGLGTALTTGAGLITWGKSFVNKYAMWIFGVVLVMFLSKMFKVKL